VLQLRESLLGQAAHGRIRMRGADPLHEGIVVADAAQEEQGDGVALRVGLPLRRRRFPEP
jgi:hypothetical protein